MAKQFINSAFAAVILSFPGPIIRKRDGMPDLILSVKEVEMTIG